MSDKGTDAFVGVVLVLIVVVMIAGATGGPSALPPTPEPTATRGGATVAGAAESSTNIPTGPLGTCRGQVIANQTKRTGDGSLNLKVYYSPVRGGRNCAVATKVGAGTGPPGQIVVTLRFATYAGSSWPRYAEHRSERYAVRSGSVYLDHANRRCVRASATFTPSAGGRTVTVSSGTVGCG